MSKFKKVAAIFGKKNTILIFYEVSITNAWKEHPSFKLGSD